MIWLTGCVVAVVSFPRQAPDATISADVVVDCLGAGDFLTIADAIAGVESGMTIGLAPCTYDEDVDYGGKSITLFGIDGSKTTILRGTGATSVVRVAHGESYGTRLVGVTLSNGGAPATGYGSALFVEGAVLSLRDVVITGNNSGSSVISIDGAMVDATDLVITGNAAASAVAYVDNSSLLVQRMTMTCDGAQYGFMAHAATIVLDSQISCGDGVGAYASGNDIHVRRSRIESTSYAVYGADGDDTRNERLWLYNSALVGGDTAVYSQYMHVKVDNSVIWGERVGLQLEAGHLESKVRNSVLVGSECGLQGDGFLYDVAWDVFVGTGAACNAEGTDLLSADPQFINPPADFTPTEGSPLIDGGDPERDDADGTRRDIGMFGGPGGAGEP